MSAGTLDRNGDRMNAVMPCSGQAMQMKTTMNGTCTEAGYDNHTGSTAKMPQRVGVCNGAAGAAGPRH